MKQQHTKKQIIEAIAYWKSILKDINENYERFYCKNDILKPFKRMNINSPRYIIDSISKSCISFNNSICAFNSNSLMNIMRIYETDRKYLDEKERKTENTSKLIDILSKYCKNNIKNWNVGISNFTSLFDVQCYDPNDDHTIYGNVMLSDFPFDVTKISIEKHIEMLSRRALLLGYNYVAHDISKVIFDNSIKHCYTSIQFEATYFSSNVKVGDALYHIAPKSIVNKILRQGLIPSNKNQYGFNYGSRVYAFIDKYDEIMSNYAAVAGKTSKKFIFSDALADEVHEFYEELSKKASGTLFDTHEFCILKIDTSKIKDIIFYRDNTFDIDGDFIAVYSVDSIQPNAIEVVGEFVA